MIEQMAKRLDRVIDKFKIPFAAKVSIKKTIQSEIIKLCGETSDTVRMIDIWTLVDSMGFTAEQIAEFAAKTQENYDDVYGRYGLDAIFALKRSLAERGIRFAEAENGNGK